MQDDECGDPVAVSHETVTGDRYDRSLHLVVIIHLVDFIGYNVR